VATFSTVFLGCIVPGDAIQAQYYGYITVPADMLITGLQGTVNGSVPSGSDLRFRLIVDSYEVGEPLTIAENQRRGVIDFLVDVSVYQGSVLRFLCFQIGTVEPGSWIEIRVTSDVAIIE